MAYSCNKNKSSMIYPIALHPWELQMQKLHSPQCIHHFIDVDIKYPDSRSTRDLGCPTFSCDECAKKSYDYDVKKDANSYYNMQTRTPISYNSSAPYHPANAPYRPIPSAPSMTSVTSVTPSVTNVAPSAPQPAIAKYTRKTPTVHSKQTSNRSNFTSSDMVTPMINSLTSSIDKYVQSLGTELMKAFKF